MVYSTSPSCGAVPALVLAAGASRRMGRAKALLAMSSGETLLEHAIANARLLTDRVLVVTGAWYPLLRYRCRVQPSAWVYAHDWQEGMAASLRLGLSRLGAGDRGAFVLLVDQPLIETDSLRKLGKAAREEPAQAFAADYGGRPGAPAYLPRRLWSQVAALKGDRGAAAVLAQAGAVTLTMPGAAYDVDTPEHWREVRGLAKPSR